MNLNEPTNEIENVEADYAGKEIQQQQQKSRKDQAKINKRRLAQIEKNQQQEEWKDTKKKNNLIEYMRYNNL